MKFSKRTAVGATFVVLLVFALLNLLLFLTLPADRTSSGVFWLAWSFFTPVSLTVALVYVWFGLSAGDSQGASSLYRLIAAVAFVGASFVLGIIFMYAPITSFTAPLILYAIMIIVTLVLFIFANMGANYIAGQERKTKEKVLALRLWQIKLEGCMAQTQNGAIIAALNALADDVRFSDPMSQEGLASVETEITGAIEGIRGLLSIEDVQESAVLALVQKAQALLKERNSLCRAYK